MENLRVLEGSEVFFRGLQHLYHQFKSGWRLFFYSSLAQSVEHAAVNRSVVGSSPTGGVFLYSIIL